MQWRSMMMALTHRRPSDDDAFPAVTAPSWSWAAVDTAVGYRLWQPLAPRHVDQRGERFHELAAVRALTVEQPDRRSFAHFRGLLSIDGASTDARLLGHFLYIYKSANSPVARDIEEGKTTLQKVLAATGMPPGIGPLVVSAVSSEDAEFQHPAFHTARFLADNTLETQAAGTGRRVKILLLASGGYTKTLTAQYCLVLERDGPTYHRRIGMCALDPLLVCLSAPSKCPTCPIRNGVKPCLGNPGRFDIR